MAAGMDVQLWVTGHRASRHVSGKLIKIKRGDVIKRLALQISIAAPKIFNLLVIHVFIAKRYQEMKTILLFTFLVPISLPTQLKRLTVESFFFHLLFNSVLRFANRQRYVRP